MKSKSVAKINAIITFPTAVKIHFVCFTVTGSFLITIHLFGSLLDSAREIQTAKQMNGNLSVRLSRPHPLAYPTPSPLSGLRKEGGELSSCSYHGTQTHVLTNDSLSLSLSHRPPPLHSSPIFTPWFAKGRRRTDFVLPPW